MSDNPKYGTRKVDRRLCPDRRKESVIGRIKVDRRASWPGGGKKGRKQ